MYHVAFGMASQAEFSRRVRHFAALGVPFSPVDHLMSKALYLSDPDGHSIEIAWETPERFGRFSTEGGRFTLIDADGNTHSGRERLDLKAELDLADDTAPALPLHRDTNVAHLHLHVPGLEPALDWFEGIGFARNLLLPDFGMADMGAGAPYTHRLAVNVWAGPGAKPAPEGMARLLGYTLYTTDQQAFEQAKSRLTQGDEASALTGKDPAGVTLHLHFGHPDLKTEAAA
jgi:catechol 2,3-dioxygenase